MLEVLVEVEHAHDIVDGKRDVLSGSVVAQIQQHIEKCMHAAVHHFEVKGTIVRCAESVNSTRIISETASVDCSLDFCECSTSDRVNQLLTSTRKVVSTCHARTVLVLSLLIGKCLFA
jgi:hypothetical protein